MPFTIVRQDITKMNVDAIVNAANTELKMGGGVCGAIFKAAGAAKLQAACDKLAPIKTGEAVITPGFDLPAKYVIHAAGPVYAKQSAEESEKLLRSAYLSSLRLAVENECESIAFPLISSGIYGYPKDEALHVATTAIEDFLTEHDIDVSLVIFDKSSFVISRELIGAVESYIDDHYVDTREKKRRKLLRVEHKALSVADAVPGKPYFDEISPAEDMPLPMERRVALPKEKAVPIEKTSIPSEETTIPPEEIAEATTHFEETSLTFEKTAASLERMSVPVKTVTPLEDLVGNLDEPFSEMLLRLIDAKEMTDVEVYKRANLDRRLFSKIRSNRAYMPSKRTAISLAVALKLSLDETNALLKRAGYALSHAVKLDVIVEYFIANGKYDIFKINQVLFEYDQPLLGG
ncbi:MAG: macro domain-containing protein [Saccharofermentanales bacterium]|jgi:O-acetyl-ADP-ribose deacetylase (regulator of RNase III)